MRLAVPLIALIVVLGGCAAPSQPLEATVTSSVAAPGPDISDTEGAIRGVVIDTSLSPLANATVTLASSTSGSKSFAQATTDAAGEFAFSLVPIGSYRIAASLEGFANRSALADVIAGEVSQVRIILDDVARAEPYVILLQKNGIVKCAAALIVWPGEHCSSFTGNAVPDQSEYTLEFPVPDGFLGILSETTWPADETNSQQFENHNTSTSAVTLAIVDLTVDRKPMRNLLVPGQERQASTGVLATVFVPVPEEAFTLIVKTFYGGILADEFNQTLNPVCTAIYLPRCVGIGAVVEYRYSQYVSVFVNGFPADLAAYTALPDE